MAVSTFQRFLIWRKQISWTYSRDNLMIYRGPGFFSVRMIRLLAHPHLPPSLVSKLSLFLSLSVWGA